MSTDHSRARLLGDISRNAHRLMDVIGRPGPSKTPHPSSLAQAALCSLPDPQPIAQHLIASGYRPAISRLLCKDYLRHARDLKTRDERQMRTTIEAWISVGEESREDADAKIARLVFAYRQRHSAGLQQLLKAYTAQLQQIVAAKRNQAVRTTGRAGNMNRPFSQVSKSQRLLACTGYSPYWM